MTPVGKRWSPRRLRRIVLAAGVAGCSAAWPGPVHALPPESPVPGINRDQGIWDLNFERGNRRCRLFLRSDSRARGFALTMPPGCHHAFPLLATVTNWTQGQGEHVLFHTDDGATVVDFAPTGAPELSGVAATDVYTLTPLDPVLQEEIKQTPVAAAPPTAAPDAPTAAEATAPVASQGVVVERFVGRAQGGAQADVAVAAPPILPPASEAEVAGNYAVIRKDRDTGCMVTLEADGRGSKGAARAKLAPACGDQGIVIFDPTSWRIVKDELVLTAKRGHSTALTRRDQKTWANAPKTGAALVLKRL